MSGPADFVPSGAICAILRQLCDVHLCSSAPINTRFFRSCVLNKDVFRDTPVIFAVASDKWKLNVIPRAKIDTNVWCDGAG